MSDTPTPTSSTEKTIVVNSAQLCRLWTFTYISIGLNVLILALFLVCAIVHHHGHHKQHHRHGHGGGERGGQQGWGQRGGGGQGFHRHFGGMGGPQGGWGRPGGFGGGDQGNMDRGRGPGMGGPGMMRGGGFGGRGMRDGGAPPDPAKMTDAILNRLSTQLTLTDDEKAKIKPIIMDQATQMQKDMEAQHLARQKAMEDTKAKIKALLTPDQQKQLDAMPLPGQKPADASAAPAAPPAAK